MKIVFLAVLYLVLTGCWNGVYDAGFYPEDCPDTNVTFGKHQSCPPKADREIPDGYYGVHDE